MTVPLVFTTREGGPLGRGYDNTHVWKPALVAAELEPTRANGMHALRHDDASVLLDEGASIRALADYLGQRPDGSDVVGLSSGLGVPLRSSPIHALTCAFVA